MQRRLATSLTVQDRLKPALEFLSSFSREEVLLVATTRPAADELVRQFSNQANGAFGVHRFTLPLLAYTIASGRLAEAGVTALAGVAVDALAARAVHACRANGELSWFEPVAATPGFFRALGSTITELRLDDVSVDRIAAAGPSGKDLAGLLTRFNRDLEESKVADLATVYKTATALIRDPDFQFKGRPLLLLDIAPVSQLEQDMIQALVEAATDVLATAHERDDASVHILQLALTVTAERSVEANRVERALDRLRVHIFKTTAPPGVTDSSVEFLSATDESRECVEIARSMVSLAESGIPFDRMAILLRNPDAYQPLVEDALRRAGIPGFYTFGSRRPNPAGRALLALLACASEGLSASRFGEYLSIGQTPEVDDTGNPPRPEVKWAPIQGELFADVPTEVSGEELEEDTAGDDKSPVVSGSLQAPYQWERLLVDAAVIGGRDRWVRRLDGLDRELQKQMVEVAGEDESTEHHLERQRDRLGHLRRFALPIIEFLDSLPVHATWSDWLDSLELLATMCLRRPEPVLSVLGELRPMGDVGPVNLDEVQEVLTHRLTFLRVESTERRYGKVFVATIPELTGLSFDIVFLPGLAEDIFPRKAFEDPLLLDSQRQAVGPRLAVQNARIARERLLLHIAAGAASSKLWISYPRMDLAQGRQRSPSFYALDILRAMTGRIPDLGELQRQSAAHSQSQVGWPAPRDPGRAIDDTEYDLATISQLLRLPTEESRGGGRYLLTVNASLARSLRTRAGRWRGRWMEGDGIVSSAANILEVLAAHRPSSRPYSATALQHFAICPYRFLLSSIHRIQPRAETAAIERMDALTRGSLFHATQFRILSELRTLGLLPVDLENLARVIEVADRALDHVAENYREELAPAIPRIWEREIEDIRWDLRGWLRAVTQTAEGIAGPWLPRWFELSFGLSRVAERDPASSTGAIELSGGIHVRGAIDMVEENAGAIRITDHKTGRALQQPPGLTGHGEILQPILYAQAAEVILGKPAVSARLFFCTDRGGYRLFEIPIDDQSRQALSRVITIIDQSMADGFLPAAPRADACAYCDYRVVCGPYEESRVRLKSQSRLAALNELREMP